MAKRKGTKRKKTGDCAVCGKKIFTSWEDALRSVCVIQRHGGPALRIYQCTRDDLVVFHMTHRRKGEFPS